MTKTISAHFDGLVIVPDESLQLPVGQPLTVHIEVPDSAAPRFAEFLQLEADLPDAPADMAKQHDHYLYGSPNEEFSAAGPTKLGVSRIAFPSW